MRSNASITRLVAQKSSRNCIRRSSDSSNGTKQQDDLTAVLIKSLAELAYRMMTKRTPSSICFSDSWTDSDRKIGPVRAVNEQ